MSEYEIKDFNLEKLVESFSNPRIPQEKLSENDKLIYLFEYLSELNTETIIVENEYVDGGYLEDYSEYYSKCFRKYDRMCKRVHFFSCKIDGDIFESFVAGEIKDPESKSIQDSYGGFAVARPLPERVIGRTVLRTYPSDGGRRKYHSTIDVNANLFGADFSVASLPFQEQDNVVAACATVSLWSALQKTAELFNSRAPRPAAITKTANQAIEPQRSVPSGGLTLRQVAHAVRSVGLTPEVFDIKGTTPIVSLMSSYLQFGLPLILTVQVGDELHAVTVTGYSIRQNRQLSREVADDVSTRLPVMEGLWIDEFYAHDDGVGPFSRLDVVAGTTKYPVTFESDWPNPLLPRALIIPVYDKIRVTFLDIQEWLTRLAPVVRVVDPDKNQGVKWNVRLTTVNELKREIRGRKELKRKIGIGNAKYILKKSQPRFIWRVEAKYRDTSLFEILADATDMRTSFPAYEFIAYKPKFVDELKRVVDSQRMESTLRDILGKSMLKFMQDNI